MLYFFTLSIMQSSESLLPYLSRTTIETLSSFALHYLKISCTAPSFLEQYLRTYLESSQSWGTEHNCLDYSSEVNVVYSNFMSVEEDLCSTIKLKSVIWGSELYRKRSLLHSKFLCSSKMRIYSHYYMPIYVSIDLGRWIVVHQP